ncbi:DUF3566 domain-containing protein [Demequina mangrovi]|uniref:DUF3566 domain-containing protein n=1 Tax=Demequina mangrovi TaxID=1043493 RepID=A0A1H6ZXE0_9MICO|nr:DUF3566 domain-containing protein [Demequina mangrovi]SEJ57316.1 Transmembrane protein of unknown function [Demequina mangrovi]
MNADDRTTSTARGLYTPRPTEPTTGQVPSRRAFMPVGAETPAQPQTPSTQVPTTRPASTQTPTSRTAAPQTPAAPAPAPQRTPVTGQTPTAPSAAPTSTGSIPTRTAFRPQSAPDGISTTRAAQPQQPQAFAPTGVPAPAATPAEAPAAPQAPADSPNRRDAAKVTSTAAIGAGAAKVRDLAGRAADSFKAGDDLGMPASKGGPRKARVLLSRIDPWSALKLGFLLSIAAGIMFVVAVFVLWTVLNQAGVFALVNEWVVKLFSTDSEIDIMQFVDPNKVMGAATLVAVINVVLLTALSTIGAFLYNVVSSVVGGVYVTLTDD